MGKKKSSKIGKWALRIALALVALLLVCSAVYFLFFTRITLVADSTFLQVYPSSDIWKLRVDYASRGTRLRVLKLADSSFDSPDRFKAAVSKARGKAVVLSPIASEYCIQEKIDVSALLEKSVVLGIHSYSSNKCFDCTLVPNERSGWMDAATSLEAETSKMSQNVALVYDSGDIAYIEDIVMCFPEGHVSEFKRQSSSSLFQTMTLSAMDEQGIVFAMCPYVSSFHRFFISSTTVQWIIDYRFVSVVPKSNLYGLVTPDFKSIPGIAKNVEKGSRSMESLAYIYVKK
ncbi:MAG: hypothetical protein IKP61_02695 [Spirochaetales bacterium]|nr:hypothetical protein [Spirochaetales bacterium]